VLLVVGEALLAREALLLAVGIVPVDLRQQFDYVATRLGELLHDLDKVASPVGVMWCTT
jgi:hypothetical protein